MDKQKALEIMSSAAQLYNKNLVSRKVLVIAKNKNNLLTYELFFNKSNFLHFTGIKTKLSPADFYDALISNRLRIKDFNYKNDLLAERKLKVMESAMTLIYSAKKKLDLKRQ
jgi:hypothetical protein